MLEIKRFWDGIVPQSTETNETFRLDNRLQNNWRIKRVRGEPFEEFHHILGLHSTEYLKLLYITHVSLLIFAESDVLDDGGALELEDEILKPCTGR